MTYCHSLLYPAQRRAPSTQTATVEVKGKFISQVESALSIVTYKVEQVILPEVDHNTQFLWSPQLSCTCKD